MSIDEAGSNINYTPLTTSHTFPPLPTITGTGTIGTIGPMTMQADIEPQTPIANTVSITADGHLLVTTTFAQIKIPPKLFKDLVTLAELMLIEKLVPQEADDAR